MNNLAPIVENTVVLDDTADAALLVAAVENNGWQVTYTNYLSHGEYQQTLWTTPSGNTRVRYLEHHSTGTRFVSVYGRDKSEVSEAVALIEQTVATVDIDDILSLLLDEATENPVDIVRGFRQLSIGFYVTRVHAHPASELDERFVTAVSRHISHPHRQVRLSVMLVADELSTLWPAIVEPIVARQGIETEHADLVEAFVEVAQSQDHS